MNDLSQVARMGRLATVLGDNVLSLLRFDGTDHMNGLFTYQVECLATTDGIDFDALLGTHATVLIESADGPAAFDGIITKALWKGPGDNGWRYELTLRPWAWLATRRRNQKIFHTKTVVEIVTELFANYAHLGSPHLDIKLSGDYPVLEYTVQYRESDFACATRLLERFGISYHFRHTEGNHSMVLTDDISAHESIGERPYHGIGQNKGAKSEHFWEWGPERRLTTGAMRLTDYNFKTPMAAMEVDRIGDAAHAEGQIESYDYPGDYLDQGRGKAVVALRTDQERGDDARMRASGDCIGLTPGRIVALGGGDEVPGNGEEHVCLSANYSFVGQAYGSNAASSEQPFVAQYDFLPVKAPLSPPRQTPMPIVQGPQTAMVVGEGEIDCDEYGRILVHFHWDLEKAYSMRCRVSQNWAGKGWGGIVIPRIGMEVVVEFLEGDPDKPIITGCVYNGRTGVPYDLPANKTRSTFRSDSHGASGFNELRFEDAGGNEEIFMHAQKDHNTVIENDESHTILRDRRKDVTRDQVETVGHDKTITVDNNHTETVNGNKSETIKKNYSTTVTEGNQAVTVVTGTHTTTVKSDKMTTVQSGTDTTVVETGNRFVNVLAAGEYRTVKNDIVTISEAGSVHVKAATAVIIEAPDIVLKANDSNFISISQGTIVIEGGQTLVNPRESSPV